MGQIGRRKGGKSEVGLVQVELVTVDVILKLLKLFRWDVFVQKRLADFNELANPINP